MRESDRSWMGNGDLFGRAFSHKLKAEARAIPRASLSPYLLSPAAGAGSGREYRSRRTSGSELRDTRAHRRIGIKIIVHAAMNRGGEPRLLGRRAQPLLFLGVGNV